MKKLLSTLITLGYMSSSVAMETNALIFFQWMVSVEKESLLEKNRETRNSAHAYIPIIKHQTANPLAIATQLAGNNLTLNNNPESACTRFLDLFCCGRCND